MISAFVYGSVAAGRAGPGSDIDCFVITASDLDGPQHRRLDAGFAELQRTLGYTPDPDYPIEIFSVGACQAALRSSELDRMLTAAAVAGGMDRRMAESDEVEVLRALLDRRLVLRHAEVLDVLTTQAHALVQRHASWLHMLGLVDAPPVRR
ncbi:MAG TPA: nucleotidyltransferase domain-containing protein [Actinoplanes sp.]